MQARPPNRQTAKFSGYTVGYRSHAHRPCPLCIMHVLLLMRTGLVRVGKGHRQHMSKLHDNADARCTRDMYS